MTQSSFVSAGWYSSLGGGSPRDRVVEGIDILLSNPNVKGVFINILGGITRCDDVAAGLVEYRDQKGIDIPFVNYCINYDFYFILLAQLDSLDNEIKTPSLSSESIMQFSYINT